MVQLRKADEGRRLWVCSVTAAGFRSTQLPSRKTVALQVTDRGGEPYRLPNPCRLTASGWVSSANGTRLAVAPVKWKPYNGPRSRPAR
jgi:hypothetical protein